MWTALQLSLLSAVLIALLWTLRGLLASHRKMTDQIADLATQKTIIDAMFIESMTPQLLECLPDGLVRLCNELRSKYRDVISPIQRSRPPSREQRDLARNQECQRGSSVAQCDPLARPSDSRDTESATDPRENVIVFPSRERLPN